MNGRGPQSAPSVTTTLIVLATLAATAFLVWNGDISGDAAIGLFSAIIGGVLVRAGVAQGSKATADPPADA